MQLNQKILDENPCGIVMEKTGYYKQLSENNINEIHGIETKRKYLSTRFEYISGVDFISKQALNTLKIIEEYYFRSVLAPVLRANGEIK